MEERVILVNRDDLPIGTEEKLRAHLDGRLHRAFSVFVFDPDADALLLQQRALHKYHSGGLWSNTCCSHPRPGEPTTDAAHRRLREEMGFDCDLDHAFGFVYHADLGGGVVEHEYDHVFVGRFAGAPTPDPAEVAGWQWTPIDRVCAHLAADPDVYTVWFRIALNQLLQSSGSKHEWAASIRRLPHPGGTSSWT